jgi:hypothetical protein
MYYRTETARPMLLNAIGVPTSIAVEVVQTLYQEVRDRLKLSTVCRWEASGGNEQYPIAKFETTKSTKRRPKPLAVRLASRDFQSTFHVTQTYIGSSEWLDTMCSSMDAHMTPSINYTTQP